MTAQELYFVAVHELRHLWDIEKDSKNIHSIMYFQNPNPSMVLDSEDVASSARTTRWPQVRRPAPIEVLGRPLIAKVRFEG